MADGILSLGDGGRDVGTYDTATDGPMSLVGEGSLGDALVVQALGKVRPQTPGGGGSIGDVSREGVSVDNRITRWHGTDAEIQSSVVTINDDGDISGYGTLIGGNLNTQLVDSDGLLRILAIGQNGATDRQAMLWDAGGGTWVVDDILEPGMVDISADTNLVATSPIVLTDDTLSHAVSGVSAGTWTSLTVDVLGHVTVGTNPGFPTGSGTADYMSKWISASVLGDADMTDDGSDTIVVSNDFTVQAGDFFVSAGLVGIHTASPEVFLHVGPDAPTGTYLDSVNNNGLLVAPNALRGIIAVEGNSEAWLTLTAQDGTANQRKFGIEVDGTTAFFRSLNDALGLRQIFIQAEMPTTTSDLLFQPGGGDTVIGGDTYWTGEDSGLDFAEIYVKDNTTPMTVNSAAKVQVAAFVHDGQSNSAVPSHVQNDITITRAGKYKVICSLTVENSAGAGHTIGVSVWKNNGTTELTNIHAHRTLSAGTDVGSISLSGACDCAASDTLEVWIETDSGVDRQIIVEDINLYVEMAGGT